MCLILIAYHYHPGYPLLVAANRDEFYARPTKPLAFWEDAPDILAGRDLTAGGSWMGITLSGRFAALTNYRDPSQQLPGAPSRGHLVSDYLQGTASARTYLERLAPRASAYNGFNLLLGDQEGLFYYANQSDELRLLAPGLYGLSNHRLNTPWPKLQRSRQSLQQLLDHQPDPSPDDLLHLLTDRTPAPDAELPETGVPLEWERWLSPIFITAPGYGTRSSTVLLVDRQRRAHMTEISWPEAQRATFHVDWPLPV